MWKTVRNKIDETYIVRNKDKFILMSTPIDWKLGRWYRAATKIQATYLQKFLKVTNMYTPYLIPNTTCSKKSIYKITYIRACILCLCKSSMKATLSDSEKKCLPSTKIWITGLDSLAYKRRWKEIEETKKTCIHRPPFNVIVQFFNKGLDVIGGDEK